MKFLVIGVGSIGARHAQNLIRLGHEVYGSDLLIKKMPNGVKAALGKLNEYHGVVIATPTSQHLEYLNDAIDAGAHVFVEKPIVGDGHPDTVLDINDLLEEAEQKKLVIMTGYNLRFHSCVAQAEMWLKEGKIGKPLWSHLVCSQYTEKSGYKADGVAMNWSHEIDLALHLFGPATVVAAANRYNGPTEEMMDMVLEHKTGVRSLIHLDYVTPDEIRATVIVGDKGHIMIDLVNRVAVLNRGGKEPEAERFADTWDDNYLWEMHAFVDRIHGKQTTAGATGWDGLAAVNIAHRAREKAGTQ